MTAFFRSVSFLLLFSSAFLASSCTTQPAMMFTVTDDPAPCRVFKIEEECGTLAKRGSSTFYLKEDSTVEVSMLAARFPNLPENAAGRGYEVHDRHLNSRKGSPRQKKSDFEVEKSIGNREILIFANIFKNGQFSGTAVITDLAEHQSVGEFVAITNPDFMKTTAFGDDLSYMRIEFRAFEVDAIALAKAARRWNQDQNNQYASRIHLGNGFSFGVGMIIKDAANLATGLSRLPLEALVSQINADPLFRHSIYLVRTDSDVLTRETEAGETHFALVSNASTQDRTGKKIDGFMERNDDEQYEGIDLEKLKDDEILDQLPIMLFQLEVTEKKQDESSS